MSLEGGWDRPCTELSRDEVCLLVFSRPDGPGDRSLIERNPQGEKIDVQTEPARRLLIFGFPDLCGIPEGMPFTGCDLLKLCEHRNPFAVSKNFLQTGTHGSKILPCAHN